MFGKREGCLPEGLKYKLVEIASETGAHHPLASGGLQDQQDGLSDMIIQGIHREQSLLGYAERKRDSCSQELIALI